MMHNMVQFLQFKKPEKHPWRGVTFSAVASAHKVSHDLIYVCLY